MTGREKAFLYCLILPTVAETGYHPADRIPGMKDGEQMEELSAFLYCLIKLAKLIFRRGIILELNNNWP
jgi:hypothetical protein